MICKVCEYNFGGDTNVAYDNDAILALVTTESFLTIDECVD